MANQLNENEMHIYVEERLSEYVDNRLPANERARVEKHLQECERCAASLRSMTWTISLLKQAPAPALPHSFVLPITEKAPARRPSFAFRFGLAFAGVAAVFLVAIITASFILRNGSTFAPAAAPNQLSLRETVPTSGTPQIIESADTATTQAKSNADTTSGASQAQATTAPQPTSVLSILPLQPTVNSAAQPASPPSASGVTVETTPSLRNTTALTTFQGQVISDTLSVRAGPDDSYPEITQLKRNDTVNVIGRESGGDWFVLRLDNPPEIGWVEAGGIRLLTNEIVPTVIVATATPTP